MKTAAFMLVVLSAAVSLAQQSISQTVHATAGQSNAFTKIDAPAIYLYRDELGRTETSTFNVSFASDFPANARPAFSRAAEIWSYLVNSSQAITINAQWNPLGVGTLAQTKPDSLFKNFPNAPKQNALYPVALAEALSGQNLNGSATEITIEVDSNQANWYFGTDGNTPAGKYDLVTAIMHEIAHGLGFDHSFSVNGLIGRWGSLPGSYSGFATIYDDACVVGNNHGTSIYRLTNTSEYPNPSQALGDQLRGNNVHFDGLNVFQINNNSLAKLFAPSAWSAGSSISHLDELTYLAGNSNSLMSPQQDMAEAIHSPGEIGMAILQDMGWTINRAITITKPMAGQVWTQGTSDTIWWTDNKYLGGPLSIQLWKRNVLGGYDFHSTIANVISNQGRNPYVWTASAEIGTYRIKMLNESEGYGMSVAFEISTMQQVAAPVINPPGGVFSQPQSVTLTCATTGAQIHYTTDGQDPDENSATYGDPITISGNGVLKAKAYKSGYSPSVISFATFVILGSLQPPTITPISGQYPVPLRVNISWPTGTRCFLNYTSDGTTPCDPMTPGCQLEWFTSGMTIPFTGTWRIAARTFANDQWSLLVSISYVLVPGVRIAQVDAAGLSFGEWSRWEDGWHPYRDTTFIRPGSTETWTLRSSQEYKPETTQKYNTWVRSDGQNYVVNHADAQITPSTSSALGNFKPSKSTTIQAQLVDGGSIGGTIDFKDPWLIDTSDTKGPKNRGLSAVWHNLTSPFNPESSATYKGVFLNQPIVSGQPYYSVGAPNPNYFNGVEAYFQGWWAFQDSLEFQHPELAQTPLVFKQPGAVGTALYKAHLASGVSNALAGNNQRKIIRDSYGGLHMVYPSGGSIWYCRSTNEGASWSQEIQLNVYFVPLTGALNRFPSIAFIPGTNSVMVVWEAYDEEETGRGLCFCELNLSGGVIYRDEGYSITSTPGLGSVPGIGVGRTGSQHSLTYYPLILWYNPDYPNAVRAIVRSEGIWHEEGLNGLSNVTQFGVAPFCYRVNQSPEWDITYIMNNTVYYAPVTFGYSVPTLGTPEIVTAGGMSRDVMSPSIYVVGGNAEPVSGSPAITWEQTQPGRAIGFSMRNGTSWERPAYFSHHGHTTTNPVLGVFCDAGTGSLYVDLLWQCGDHIARISRSIQTPLWSPIVSVGQGSTPAITASLLPTGPIVRASVTPNGQLYAISTAALPLPQFEQWGQNWNIAGISVRVPNYAPTAVFPSAISPVYKFECEGYVQVTTNCDSNRGFWTKFPLTQPWWPISYTGTFIDSMVMPVRNCWNMIGSISVPVDTEAVRYEPDGIRSSVFFKYASGTGYVIVSVLNPGLGFWVKSSQVGHMILQSSPVNPGSLEDRIPKDKFIVTDGEGNRQELYVVNSQVSPSAGNIEMPPPPPEFDVRWETGDIQVAVEPTGNPIELPISINEAVLPITLEWELDPETGLEYNLPAGGGLHKGSSQSIAGKGRAVFSLQTSSIVLVANGKNLKHESEVPTVFALHPNYPNPFNPTTEMRFDLPEAGTVSLIIYDVLGRQVAELASGYREAGYHSATWHASNQASGIYFARFNVTDAAGNMKYSKVTKLILMK